jgi:preprotein translocase subunit YajC
MAPPLPAREIRMTAHGVYLLLFAPAGQNAGGGLTVFVIQIAALIAIFYFMLIRPQRKQQERHRHLLASLQRGDRVVTSGGIVGEVIHLKDDEVTVKSGESRLIVLRANIANILNRSAEPAAPAKPQ